MLTELVTRKSENRYGVVIMMKRTQTCVLRREASSARYVDDEAGRVGKVRERNLVTGDRRHGELVELSHMCLLVGVCSHCIDRADARRAAHAYDQPSASGRWQQLDAPLAV